MYSIKYVIGTRYYNYLTTTNNYTTYSHYIVILIENEIKKENGAYLAGLALKIRKAFKFSEIFLMVIVHTYVYQLGLQLIF